ncbi:MAG: OmpH family outer membrane protein [Pseudomonadota bacterium]|nr:OmpH family outer membrane protein [Pseudomonadota bacterium]
MKKILIVMLGLLAVFPVLAAEQLKIVTVDVRKAVLSTEEGQLKLEKLKAELEKDRAELESLNMKGKDLQDRIKKDGAVMSADERHKLEKELMEVANEVQFKKQQLQKSGQADQVQMMESLIPKFEKALNEIIAQQGIDLVLRSEVVIGANPKLDITDQVVKKMNAYKD